jgi:hypothetical protein
MTSPKEPFQGELETDVQRTAALLDEAYKATEAGEAPRHDKVVILRALVLSVQTKLVPPSAVDALLDGRPVPGGAPVPVPSYQHPFYGPPGKIRPRGAPDPGAFGPQSF